MTLSPRQGGAGRGGGRRSDRQPRAQSSGLGKEGPRRVPGSHGIIVLVPLGFLSPALIRSAPNSSELPQPFLMFPPVNQGSVYFIESTPYFSSQHSLTLGNLASLVLRLALSHLI